MRSDFNVESWLDSLLKKLTDAYGERLLFVGHIGSWVRGEAGPASDIDVNVILDRVEFDDLMTYRRIVSEMPHPEKACGFIAGKAEMRAWPRTDRFHFINGCRVLYGCIRDVVEDPSPADIAEYIKIAASAILHEARHLAIYEWNDAAGVHSLRMAFKSSFFVLQAWMTLSGGGFILSKRELLSALPDGIDAEVLRISMEWDALGADREARPEYYCERLVRWSGEMLLKADGWIADHTG